MRKHLRPLSVIASTVALLSLGLSAPAIAAPPNVDWNRSNIAVNLGGQVDGGYLDAQGAVFDGTGQIVIDIDGAFTSGNSLMKDSAGLSKVAGEYCFGLDAPKTAWPNLCQTTNQISSSYLYATPSYFSTLPGSSTPNPACVSSAGTPCHDYHGTATAGAAVGQAGKRWELNSDGSYTIVSTAGAAVGAKVVQVKVGGGTTTGVNDSFGWSGESVVNALNWIDAVGSESAQFKGRIAAINLSVSGAPLSSGGSCTGLGQAIDTVAGRLKAKGIAVVMAAGNDGLAGVGTWNCGANVITVGATSAVSPGTLSSYSNRGPSTRLYAPVGEGNATTRDGVLLPWKSSGTFYVMGTSFASPQVAGAFAVLRQKFGATPTVDQLAAHLAATGGAVSGLPAGQQGKVINVRAALSGTP
ncbi:S8 family serine peptidase [Arthrobacter sp. NPDC090010]|uniref:S8 family serine peptidase n=1 Tax=Arthrobacter sp. NPDC090010 TaxID=3363942 RepID=UPI00381A13CD